MEDASHSSVVGRVVDTGGSPDASSTLSKHSILGTMTLFLPVLILPVPLSPSLSQAAFASVMTQ